MTRSPSPHAPRRVVLALAALCSLGAQAQSAAPNAAETAAEAAALTELRQTTTALIEALVEQGLLTRSKADELLRKAKAAGRDTTTTPNAQPGVGVAENFGWGAPRSVVRVPYLPETARARMKEEIRNDILFQAREEGWTDGRRLPSWLRGVTIEGDVRVRAQSELFDKDNVSASLFALQNYSQESPAWAPDLTNTQNDRTRMTTRARLGARVKASESVSAGVRIATGATTGSPNSESQTQGGNGTRYTIGLDRAFMQWEPTQGLSLAGGRMAVAYDHSDLIFPDDLSIDGAMAKGELDLDTGLFGFANLGAHPLEEFANSARDKWLFGAQIGMDWSPNGTWQMRTALGLYDFRHVEGVREIDPPPVGQNAGSVPYLLSQYPASVRQKGNTLININAPICIITPSTAGCSSTATWGLASKFRPVDLTLSVVNRQFRPVEVSFDLDVVRNTGFDIADISQRAGQDLGSLKKKNTGYQARLGVGMARPKDRGDWRGWLAYRHFERDAWLDAWTDANWHGGGTNYKGFGLGGEYAYENNATIGLRFYSTRELDDGVRFPDQSGKISGNLSSAPLRIDTVQLEASVRF